MIDKGWSVVCGGGKGPGGAAFTSKWAPDRSISGAAYSALSACSYDLPVWGARINIAPGAAAIEFVRTGPVPAWRPVIGCDKNIYPRIP